MLVSGLLATNEKPSTSYPEKWRTFVFFASFSEFELSMACCACPQDLDLYDVQTIDPELGRTLLEMQGLVRRKQFLEKESRDAHEAINGLRFQGSSFEDLCLDFTLPGYPEFTLKPGGKDIMVRLCNIVAL